MRQTLIVFFKSPELGRVKTRLATDIGEEPALKIYISLVKETLAVARRWVKQAEGRKLVYWGTGIRELWPLLGIHSARLQFGNDLGQRMELAMREELNSCDQVAIIGTDLPHLSLTLIEESFLNLKFSDMAIGPSPDGGYYLMASSYVPPCVFSDLPWSHVTTRQRVLRRWQGFGLTTSILEEQRDIDTFQDLKILNYRPDLWA